MGYYYNFIFLLDLLSTREKDKIQTRLSKETKSVLEDFFKYSDYPSLAQKRHLAEKTGASLRKVSRWFNSRRIREKRTAEREIRGSTPQNGRSDSFQASVKTEPEWEW